MKRHALALCLLTCMAAHADTALLPFTSESLATIKKRHEGHPFVLALWSVTCSHCLSELRPLGNLARRLGLPLALVSTDSSDEATQIRAALKQAGLAHADAWVFSDPVPERLQYAIDPAWHGELPRSYLFDANHGRETVSGALSDTRLKTWFHQRPARP
jgi:hypothetical protein